MAEFTQVTFDAARAARPDLHPVNAILRALGTPRRPSRTLAERRADFAAVSGLSVDHPLFPEHLR